MSIPCPATTELAHGVVECNLGLGHFTLHEGNCPLCYQESGYDDSLLTWRSK